MKKAIQSLLSGSAPSGTLAYEIAYALFRLYCGFSIAIGAGLSKVFHKINEDGGREWDNLAFGVPDWFVEQVGDIGFTVISPSFWAHLAVYGEFIGGLLIAVGLFTRISALQLAFQFFVVSFIWYKEPELFGMYYQQLIFWSFALIAVLGGGRYSVEHWWSTLKRGPVPAKTVALASLCLLPLAGYSQSAGGARRVSFTIVNPTLKVKAVDIRYFNPDQKKSSGYGYDLGALSSHAVNMPVGTRIYLKKRDNRSLAFVVTGNDNGRTFDLSDTFSISREQEEQAARDEAGERRTNLAAADEQPGVEAMARAQGLDMVTFVVVGKSPFSRQVHVRVQLPFDPKKSNTGFSRRLSSFNRITLRYPVGTKIYLCDGPYWKGGSVQETLLFEVVAEKQNKRIRI